VGPNVLQEYAASIVTTLKMEAAGLSKTLVPTYQIREDSNLSS
jgi:hypothetical protein